MFRRRDYSQNDNVAQEMTRFFSSQGRYSFNNPEPLAIEYGKFLWKHNRSVALASDKNRAMSRFYLGLQVDDDHRGSRVLPNERR
jgi:hypothetical protein